MKKYTGTKEILAAPMGLIEFNQYMDFESEAMDNKEGYLVEYLDSPNGNHPSHSNYVSWSPKDVFERAYSPSDTPLERAVTERAELLEKIDRLGDFISSDKFVDLGEEHGRLMRGQLVTMEEYAELLNWRIELMQEVKK